MKRYVNEALFWASTVVAVLCAVMVLLCVLSAAWWYVAAFAMLGLLTGATSVSSLGDIRAEAEDELKALRSIVRNYQAGYDADLHQGAWVKVIGSHLGNPPEREGHRLTERERELLLELGGTS